jgi:hypothetical protein
MAARLDRDIISLASGLCPFVVPAMVGDRPRGDGGGDLLDVGIVELWVHREGKAAKCVRLGVHEARGVGGVRIPLKPITHSGVSDHLDRRPRTG